MTSAPAELLPDHEAAKFAAETICEVANPKWKEGSFEFDALTVARAYLDLASRAEHSGASVEDITAVIGNAQGLNSFEDEARALLAVYHITLR